MINLPSKKLQKVLKVVRFKPRWPHNYFFLIFLLQPLIPLHENPTSVTEPLAIQVKYFKIVHKGNSKIKANDSK